MASMVWCATYFISEGGAHGRVPTPATSTQYSCLTCSGGPFCNCICGEVLKLNWMCIYCEIIKEKPLHLLTQCVISTIIGSSLPPFAFLGSFGWWKFHSSPKIREFVQGMQRPSRLKVRTKRCSKQCWKSGQGGPRFETQPWAGHRKEGEEQMHKAPKMSALSCFLPALIDTDSLAIALPSSSTISLDPSEERGDSQPIHCIEHAQ